MPASDEDCTGDIEADLSDGMLLRAQVLLDAGWELSYTDSDQSSEYGDSLFWGLERDGVTIELEYYDHGQLVTYPVTERDPDEELAEPYFSIVDCTVEASRAAYEAQRWL